MRPAGRVLALLRRDRTDTIVRNFQLRLTQHRTLFNSAIYRQTPESPARYASFPFALPPTIPGRARAPAGSWVQFEQCEPGSLHPVVENWEAPRPAARAYLLL